MLHRVSPRTIPFQPKVPWRQDILVISPRHVLRRVQPRSSGQADIGFPDPNLSVVVSALEI
jgi:hypothetical protein